MTSANSAQDQVLPVVVAVPQHAGLPACLSYRSSQPLAAGSWVRVPLGRRTVLGVVWDPPASATLPEAPPPAALRDITEAMIGFTPLDAHWRSLMAFVARYYQRSLGEVVTAALPPHMRSLTAAQWQRRIQRPPRCSRTAAAPLEPDPPPPPTAEQAAALAALRQQPQATQPILLQGVTGSGKTEIYLQRAANVLQAEPSAQVLVLVPEINLTPQLQQRLARRFAPQWGADAVVALHSGLPDAQRFDAWLAAHSGRARIVLGTRTAVLCSLPGLRLIVVDEEHDPSYKSQDGPRYSARDLAIYRAHALTQAGQPCQVILGSATPSLESWYAAEQGRYRRLRLPSRQGGGASARLRLVDMSSQPKGCVLAPALLHALAERAARSEQSLLLLNRRGYAPVLACPACGWKSHCPHCSAYRVFHKVDRCLRCHHCGHTSRVPTACPDCGNLDIEPIGKGTQQLQEQVGALLQDVRRADGQPLRIGRLDADTAKTPQALAEQLAHMHRGDIDVLVGTQMVAKGHDFRRITLVAVLNADAALFAADYRAPERLFSLLMQAAGRAGRDASLSAQSELWIQTHHPDHPLFAAVQRHDMDGFAQRELQLRREAALPPFVHQALIRAEARTPAAAQAFLAQLRQALSEAAARHQTLLYPPVPAAVQRVANIERMHMLLESPSRAGLQRVLQELPPHAAHARQTPACKGLIRWAVDVDPLSI